MAYNVEDLTNYVKENQSVILKDIVFGGEYGNTIPMFSKELGVKGTVNIHPSRIEAILQDANGACGFTPQGGLEVGEVTVTTAQKKVNTEFCGETLIGKFAEYTIRVGANQDALPFEAEIVEGLAKDINKQVEEGVWAQLNGLVEGTALTGASAYDKVMEVYMDMDESVLEDGVIFVSPSIFRGYVNDLVNKNLYHYNPSDGSLDEIFIPGAGVKVKKAKGIKGNYIFGTSPKNIIYATDFMSNAEEFKVWFSDDADTYRVKARFNYGAAVIFPELAVKGTW